MKTPITSHPIATQIDVADIAITYSLLDANGVVVHTATSQVGVPDEYCASKFANALGFSTDSVGLRYRVKRDTIWMRLKAAVGDAAALAIIKGMTEDQRIEWFSNDWFWSSNETLRGMAAQLGLNPDELLAPDPYL